PPRGRPAPPARLPAQAPRPGPLPGPCWRRSPAPLCPSDPCQPPAETLTGPCRRTGIPDNLLAEGYSAGMDTLAGHLAANVKQLRAARSFTQQQMARLSGLPRATWANLESGSANPTLAVLHRVADALQVSLEELLAPPRAASRFFPRSAVPVRQRGQVSVRQLLPDPIPG